MAAAHELAGLTVVSPSATTIMAAQEAERSPDLEELTALHREMSVQILRLEGHLEELPPERLQALVSSYLRSAIVLRDLLVRASCLPHAAPRSVSSFDRRLTEATLWAYHWAVFQLVAVRHHFGAREATETRAIPLGALSAFHELGELCASSCNVDARYISALLAIDDAIYRLIESWDGIEEMLVAPSIQHDRRNRREGGRDG